MQLFPNSWSAATWIMHVCTAGRREPGNISCHISYVIYIYIYIHIWLHISAGVAGASVGVGQRAGEFLMDRIELHMLPDEVSDD